MTTATTATTGDGGHGTRRALRPGRRPRRAGSTGGLRVADAALTIAAIGGVFCIGLVIAASVFHVTLIMFKTGSMEPTIPTGSVAVVKEIPSAEARVGDIVTVSRPDDLPITHRVTSATPVDGGLTSLTLKGDANDAEDPAPYVVDSVRIVLFSAPGLATFVVGLSNPFVLGSITLGAALLVTWAFWPRGHRSRGRRAAGRATPAVLALAGVALAAVPVLAVPAPARADEVATTVAGKYITLVSFADPEEMGVLSPGRPARWEVGVTVAPPEPGVVYIGVSASGELRDPGELDLEVLACDEHWTDGECATGESVWVARQDLAGAVARVPSSDDNPDGAREIGMLPASNDVWLMLSVTMPVQAAPGSFAHLRLHVWGVGDAVDVGGGDAGASAGSGSVGGGSVGSGSVGSGPLAFTGFAGAQAVVLALLAVAGGLALSAAARLFRRDARA